MIIASVGMASNLAALRALATEGIQRGHMALHARSVALHRRHRRLSTAWPRRCRASVTCAPKSRCRSWNVCVAPTATRATNEGSTLMIRRVVEPRDNAVPIPSLNEPRDASGRRTRSSARSPTASGWRAATTRTSRWPRASCRRGCARTCWALYAFARSADDFADEARYAAAAPRRSTAGRSSSIAASTARPTTRCSSRCARPSSNATADPAVRATC